MTATAPLRAVRRLYRRLAVTDTDDVPAPPVRGELLGPDRLRRHGRRLAEDHVLDRRERLGAPVLDRLDDNEHVLREAYENLVRAVQRDEAVSPAAEWLLDNFHVVEEQVREARESLPEGYQRQLPKLERGELGNYPRVFGLVWEFVAHTDSRFDAEHLRAFIEAYQESSPLTMGEVWAIPASFRLVLIENLRRLARGVVRARQARAEADRVAEAVREAVEGEDGDPLDPLRPFEQPGRSVDRAFVVELVQRLRLEDPRAAPALAWLEHRAARAGRSLEELVRAEHADQLAYQATVANVVGAMRTISAYDWAEFFEEVSVVEGILRRDPSGVYPSCDFATRDAYRHVVEELARGSGLREEEVARRALDRVSDGVPADGGGEREEGGGRSRFRYLGYHLRMEGRAAFERDLGYRVPLRRRLHRAFVGAAYPGYFGALFVLSAALLSLPLVYAASVGASTWLLLLVLITAMVPAMDLGLAVLHQDVTELVPPDRLPKLELEEGVPREFTTIVAVPTLLESEADVWSEVERLEERYLANTERHLVFALLSDWADAPRETMPGDEELLGAAAAAVGDLNERYGPGPDGRSRFLLLHRRRVWSETEQAWMGWERKRGKLVELNRLLRGDGTTTYLLREDGLTDVPPDARFVLTLDADTRLPPGAARRLVGAMAHPLNRPWLDEELGRVTEGYGILQPRITALVPRAGEGSPYHRLYAGSTGIDPYSSAASDVYQDLFGEGTYVGKGIYDVDAFQGALEGRVPEGTLLSHDHFEGAFARCGLVSDIELFDEFPSRYEANLRRIHRWARGDWQLLPWVVGTPPDVEGRDVPATPSFLGRWKMMDNLRRTLSPPSTLGLLVAGWTLLPGSALAWTGFVLATLAVPAVVPVVGNLVPRRRGAPLRGHLRSAALEARESLGRIVTAVAFLPQHAGLMMDAIGRTLNRLYVTRRNLLEWTPAALASGGLGGGVIDAYRRMWRPVASSVGAVAATVVVRPDAAVAALSLGAAWVAAPVLAWWLSRPLRQPEPEELDREGTRELRRVARESWRFFEETVSEETNGLPPDNLQEDPEVRVAYRTSSTNVGCYLLAVLSARDFGWIGTQEAIERVERTLDALETMERFEGHYFNWYDVRTLIPLEPRYVSTVDSGNLAGHLLATAEGCREWTTGPPPPAETIRGIRDTLELARRAVTNAAAGFRGGTVSRHDVQVGVARVEEVLEEAPEAREGWPEWLEEIAAAAETLVDVVGAASGQHPGAAWSSATFWTDAVRRCVASHRRDLGPGSEDDPGGETVETRRRLRLAASRCEGMVRETDFRLVYDPARKLFSIGYRVAERELDEGYYDLLASEARLGSLIAVATGDVGVEHWFHLGRTLTSVDHGAALVSWSGSMFEYLMPLLVMEPPPGTTLEESQQLAVRRQIEYGRERGVPWGVSESAYNARDLQLTYQYSHFGVPGLGLARGLGEELVVAPYATALASMVRPAEAVRNFRRLEDVGARGERGFYEAIDYTPDRLPKGEEAVVVRAYMAHHQGMTVAALANVVLEGRHRRRFHRSPMVRSVDVLLQERIPHDVVVTRPRREEVESIRHVRELMPPVVRRFVSPHRSPPATQLLSNGRYAVMVTAAGGGYSRFGPTAVTRWREDPTRDHWGSFVYLRDVESGQTWSAAWQPTGVEPDRYEVVFTEDRAEFDRRDGAISTSMEVLVSPEEDGELRRIEVKNQGSRVREIEVTSFAEVVLTSSAADAAHPAFEKLFVRTAFDPASDGLLATRRRRSDEERALWACHVAAVEGETVGPLQYETDRARFLERGRERRAPACVAEGRPLSNTVGPVLDPVFSLRRTLRVRPGATARITFSTLVASTREEATNLAEVHRDPAAFQRAAGLAWTQAQVRLQHLGVDADEAHLLQRLASRLLYSDAGLRATADPSPAHGGQEVLWRYGISGDLPLVLVQIDQLRDRELVRQLVRGHEYWVWKGLDVDLVILNEHAVTYADELQEWIRRLLGTRRGGDRAIGEERGGVHLLRSGEVTPADHAYLRSVARVTLHARNGSLSEQLEAVQASEAATTPPGRVPVPDEAPVAPPPHPELSFYNGLGGFAEDGRQYVIVLGEGQWTPAPWVNVVSNPRMGFVASEAGSGFTWAANSRENRLTPWSNDPVGDPPGEVMYVRDEESGGVWTPTPLPIREVTPYRIVHGQGWSRFEHEGHGIGLELTQFVPTEDPVKISRLRVRNHSGRRRRLSVTAYVEWVLGVRRELSAPHLTTELDPSSGALFARNGWNPEFAGRVAFADLGGEHDGWTADRTEFLGRHGTTASPAALATGAELSRSTGSGLDPCAVLRRALTLEPDAEAEVVFLLGQGADVGEARSLVGRYREADVDEVLGEVRDRWDDVLGALQVEVPDASMEPMLNRWLLYQTLSCRVYGRSAFYQSGGAYGFRDQLQDVMALTVSRRDLTREHLLRAASRQFPEGDVQHWWHPPSGRGVRTRIADDPLWLSFALLHYLEVTGDEAILDEEVPFLQGEALEEGEQERYFEPARSEETATLFEHCARGVEARLEGGPHGLPLMGAGDWNDGMNRVGQRGRGESVWMGWFLHLVLQGLAPLAASRGEEARAGRWRERMESLAEALERHGWDGDWYRRAYFDDGTPLGSSVNDECRIDSIAQSWAVLSGVPRPHRRLRAMQSVEQYLIRRGDALVLLFTPPFDEGELDPGYIKGYLPGVRENGGQYTHAAIWSVLAFAELGMGDEAGELFSILNPVNQAGTRSGVHRYKVEPYVSAGDVYAEPPHVGRGGWTWYTGSAGWMYRAGIEWILGFRLRGEVLRLDPCVPREWPGFRMTFRYHSATYEIAVDSPGGAMCGVSRVEVDGREARLGEDPEAGSGAGRPRVDADGAWIPLSDDGNRHVVRAWLAEARPLPGGRGGFPDAPRSEPPTERGGRSRTDDGLSGG